MKKRLLCLLSACIVLLGAVPVFAAPASLSMWTERAAYDANIDKIKLTITNNSDSEASYGMEYRLERLEDSSWKTVPTAHGKEIAIPDIAAVLPAGKSTSETIYMNHYDKPLAAGRYRVVKSVGQAEFTIPDPAVCFKIREPGQADVFFKNSETRGAFTANAAESPGFVTDLWHELLAFQKGAEPQSPIPLASITLTGKEAAADNGIPLYFIELYSSGGRTWAERNGNWYYTDDPGMYKRLEDKGRELGAFLPATGEQLIESLNALPALKSVTFTPHQFSTPFHLPGWRSDRETSGVTLSIFQFTNASAVNRQMQYLYDSGYTLGIEYRVGRDDYEGVEFRRQTFQWEEPPHFFKAGSRLVLYNGRNQLILNALTGLLGPEVPSE